MRSRRFRRNSQDAQPGDDSFLDIVANLVGVLIILVVVVGANAGSRIHKIAISEVDKAELTDLEARHEKAGKHASGLQADNHQLEARIRSEMLLADARKAERDQLLVKVSQARSELASRKEKLSNKQQQTMEHATQLATLRSEYRELDSQYTSLKSATTKAETIEHFPTPIAKTVFSDEVHFRLRGGRLVRVPMQPLIELMKDEWKEKARKLESADETLETVGPIGEFRLQYHLQAEERVVRTAYGDQKERSIDFTRFVMVPVGDQIGVEVDEALTAGSDFRNWMNSVSAEKTTVSVWVYPDGFEDFNRLKKLLYENGFKTACWPLSTNSPISGGPSGYRSTAQ